MMQILWIFALVSKTVFAKEFQHYDMELVTDNMRDNYLRRRDSNSVEQKSIFSHMFTTIFEPVHTYFNSYVTYIRAKDEDEDEDEDDGEEEKEDKDAEKKKEEKNEKQKEE